MVEGARLEFRREEVMYDEKGNAEKEVDREKRLADHDASWPPELVGYLWNWFCDLTDWRESGFGVGPLSHLEIECWSRLVGLDPPISPHEVDVLRKLDRECRSWHTRKDEENKPKSIGQSLQAVADAYRDEKKQGR